jgi:hypothetical protein
MGSTETIRKPVGASPAAAEPVKVAISNPQEIKAALLPPRRAGEETAIKNTETEIRPFAWAETVSRYAEPAGALLSVTTAATTASTSALFINMAKTAADTTVTFASDYMSFAFSTGHPELVVLDTIASALLVGYYRKAAWPVVVFDLAAVATYALDPSLFSYLVNTSEALVYDYMSFAFSTGHGYVTIGLTGLAAFLAYYHGAAALRNRKQKKDQSDQPAEKKP